MSKLLTDARERGRFLRFLVVGLIGFVIDFGVANFMLWLFPHDTQMGSWTISALLRAGTVSFLCAVVSNFIWNRFWTYPDSRSKPLFAQLVQFTIVSVIGLVIRVPILSFGEPWVRDVLVHVPFVHLTETLYDFIAHNMTLATAVLIVLFWNFFVNRYITYGDVK
jgi:putative flippase GtrA